MNKSFKKYFIPLILIPFATYGEKDDLQTGQIPETAKTIADEQKTSALHPQHQELIKLLEHYLVQQKKGETKLSASFFVPYGKPHKNAQLLHEKLIQHGFLKQEETDKAIFDKKTKEALKAFQKALNLSVTGTINEETIHALNTPLAKRIKCIKNSLKNWEKIGETKENNLVVNIPSFHLYLFRDGKEILKSPVIVGKNRHKTPQVSSYLDTIVTHPSWAVPKRLAANLWCYAGSGARGFYASGDTLIQSPHPTNPLGPLKFLFKNPYSIVLHGTYRKNLFQNKTRTLSEGCIRLKEPEKIAECLLQDPQKTKEVKKSIKNHKTCYFSAPNSFPIHIVYSTVWVDENGFPQFLKDVYRYES